MASAWHVSIANSTRIELRDNTQGLPYTQASMAGFSLSSKGDEDAQRWLGYRDVIEILRRLQ